LTGARRASLLGASNLLEDAALDRYEFVRDAYMQRRESLIRDGESPRTSDDEDDPMKTDAVNVAPSQETDVPPKQSNAGSESNHEAMPPTVAAGIKE
jgi:phospholipid-binding lipoprotein MlaA